VTRNFFQELLNFLTCFNSPNFSYFLYLLLMLRLHLFLFRLEGKTRDSLSRQRIVENTGEKGNELPRAEASHRFTTRECYSENLKIEINPLFVPTFITQFKHLKCCSCCSCFHLQNLCQPITEAVLPKMSTLWQVTLAIKTLKKNQ